MQATEREAGKRFQTRQRLLEIGLKLAATEGFAALGLKRIGAIARMSNSGVHSVFGSAEEMRRDVLECGLALLEQEALVAGRRQGGLEGVWVAWSFWLRHCRALPTFVELLTGFGDVLRDPAEASLRDEVVRFWDQWRRFVGAAVSSAKRSGEVQASADGLELHRVLLGLAGQLPALSHFEPAQGAIDWTAKAMLAAISARRVVPWSDAELGDRLRSLDRGVPIGSELLGFSDLAGIDYDPNGWSAVRVPM